MLSDERKIDIEMNSFILYRGASARLQPVAVLKTFLSTEAKRSFKINIFYKTFAHHWM